MATAKEAEEIVRRLTKKYGLLDAHMMNDIGENFNAEYRRRIDENWLAMENAVSHSVKILAKQIYGSGARFVFELLQNAEDNKFKKAANPYISFKIHPDRIVVDCNEDGFTKEDLDAICAVGKSTKSTTHGYIGAKGIGFKSVFIAASRVHIQSGHFSFEFQHRRTDPGIGMVRPIWVPPTEVLPSPLTRMTLYLHNDGDQTEIQHLKKIISMQFDDLHETCLLFLRKLKKINLEFYDENGELERSRKFFKRSIGGHRVSLETTSFLDGEETTQSRIYHITKLTATNLTCSDNRQAPETPEAQRAFSRAEVVLAFPLTKASKPLVTRKKQDLFAFLPLRKSDYKFLIHSDFDTNANRQDIVTTSRRNLDLRNWIANAFLKAVLQFCEHPTLCYEWPLFLPSPDDNSDAFWSGLDHELGLLIKKTPILKSRNRTALRLIDEVSILTNDAKDADGQPLLDDPVKDIFLSPKYTEKAENALREYGLELLTPGVVLSLLQDDLRSDNSKMCGRDTSDEWHADMAELLSSYIERKSKVAKKLKSLALLPLKDGEWTSTASGPVYLPSTNDIMIPDFLDLRVISPSAAENTNRNTLFRHLGVSEATSDEVRASIFRSYAPGSDLTFPNHKSYLHFLYRTHQAGSHKKETYEIIQVLTERENVRYPSKFDVYVPGTDHPYSPASLLTAEGPAPGLAKSFLNSRYMQDAPSKPDFFHPSWERWLCDSIGIRDRLRLLSRSKSALAKSFLYVFKHRPEKFLGLFEHLWLHEGSEFLQHHDLQSKIQDFSAQDLCGVSYSLKLKQTWLPYDHLRKSVERFMEHPEEFPFLKLEDGDIPQHSGAKWNFLNEHFSVGKDDDVDFLLDILRYVEESCPEPSTRQIKKVFDLYIALYAKLASDDEPLMQRKIKDFFSQRGIVCPSENSEDTPSWTSSPSCRWLAPADMSTLYSLESLYSRNFNYKKMRNAESLFQGTLDIGNASLDDLVDELENLQEEECEDQLVIRNIYQYLDESIESISNLRTAFESHRLIYNVSQPGESGWYKISDCLWSSETVIRGKAILDGCWEADKSFFVDKLGVKFPTLQMVYDQLRQSSETSTADIKTEMTLPDPGPIRKAKIFPVRYPNGKVVLRSADVDFSIGDRDTLRTMFQSMIRFLDFDLEDVRCLKPFFEWTRLQDRCLSKSVEEATSISNARGRPVSLRNRDLKRKAKHIARVAATFNSPRYEYDRDKFLHQLHTMAVIEVDGISSVLKVYQNRKPFEVPVATAKEHIDDLLGRLTIYVPKDRREQEICFGSFLPRKIAAWLMKHPETGNCGTVQPEAVNALTSIIGSEEYVLDEILDDQGMVQVDFEHDGEENGGGEEAEGQLSDSTPDGTDSASSDQQLTPTHSSVNDSLRQFDGSPDAEEHRTETDVETISRQTNLSHRARPRARDDSLSPTPLQRSRRPTNISGYQAPRLFSPALVPSTQDRSLEDAQYLTILKRVVTKARRATFPSRGVFDMSSMREALSADNGIADAFESFDGLDFLGRFRSTSQLERDKKIGAAGELYVFELLSQLRMDGWDRSNWQSTIRHYVTIHPRYATLEPWNRRETADLVYVDTEGSLTDMLIGCGYLNHDEWHEARPRYYIEVKTTTGPCHTPFYMSGNQYQLMQRIHHSQDHAEVYLIFRVFWVNSRRIGLCIYSDPEQLRQDGQLEFTGQTWSVTPRAGAEGA